MLSTKLTNRVYMRDKWKCRHCQDRNALHPHHVVYKSHGGPDAMWNLLTLCAQCHNAVHGARLKVTVWSVTEDNLVVTFERLRGWKPK